jgi:hypothetical protein
MIWGRRYRLLSRAAITNAVALDLIGAGRAFLAEIRLDLADFTRSARHTLQRSAYTNRRG